MTAKFLVADVFDGLATLPDASVDVVISSPPFLALRSYLPADHPDKGKEIGSEPTPAAFLDTLLAVTAELRRVLAPHGSIALELGDTYASNGGGERLQRNDPEHYGSTYASGLNPTVPTAGGEGWPLAKSKTLIPELFRIALAYGFNPLTGEPSPAGQWRVRNVVTWCRPNPPVGALGDKWRPATSDVVVACVSAKRYWDDLATRKPHQQVSIDRALRGRGDNAKDQMADVDVLSSAQGHGQNGPSGAPLLDYWEIPPTGYAGSHYATFPSALVVPLVKAMTPERVCRTCGEPSRRIVERERVSVPDDSTRVKASGNVNGWEAPPEVGWEYDRQTLGFTDCGHDDFRPGLVLDPFAGSGTTLLVAQGHGHDTIGIDLDSRNADLARERVGPMFLQVEEV